MIIIMDNMLMIRRDQDGLVHLVRDMVMLLVVCEMVMITYQ